MEIISDIRETLVPASASGDAATYRCVDCMAEYDDRQRLCPKCGSEKIDSA